jgi:hypothetical protein
MQVFHHPYVGVITISKETPVRGARIYADITDESVREGDVVTIASQDGSPLAIGVISSIEVFSAIERFEEASLSIRMLQGQMRQRPTTPHLFRKASINILIKLKDFSLDKAHILKLPERNDVDILWRALIPDERKRVLAGFIKGRELLPAFYHSDFLLGPEGAHLNVGGISGLAAKTSYVRFLMYSLLDYMERTGDSIYIVVFNVKRLDFLGLHRIPDSKEELEACVDRWGERRGVDEEARSVYKRMYDNIFNVIRNYKDHIKYYTYREDPYRNQNEFMHNTETFSYGLQDLSTEGLVAGLFEEEDEASILQINLVTKAISIVGGRGVSFEDLKSILVGLRSRCETVTVPSRLKQYCDQVNREASPHSTTVEAVIRRLDGFLEKAKRIINSRSPSDHPIRVEGFRKGINVIQLYGLHDVEKRVIVTQVINDILKVAEEAQRRGEERAFVIVVDELNKYAPAVRSPIKRSLIEVAARGRDLRISLFGAEQFPSDIDSQVLGNTGTFVIGRMSPVELEDRVYNVFGSLKTTAERLGKGEVLVHHPVYQYPLILLFPPPLNDVVRECM